MSSPRQSQGDGLGGELSPTVIKGAALIVVALLLGAFLLFKGDATDQATGLATGPEASLPTADDETTTPASAPVGGGDGPTTTAAEGPRPRNEVTVLVANGSGVPGAAGRVSDDLAGAGFLVAEPDNAPNFVDSTAIYFTGSDQAEAADVASALGLAGSVAQPMPDSPPVPDLRGATVVVILGPDIAPTS